MFIDKISLTFNIVATDHQKYIASQLINLTKEFDSGWSAARGGAYKFSARLRCPLSQADLQGNWSKDYVLLQAAARNEQGPFLRAEWNPARFSEVQRQYIFVCLNDMLDVPPPMIGKAQVTRADIAIDLPGVKIGDFVFERTNARYRTPISFNGTLQTLYLGKSSHGQICIYDKGAQLGQAHLTMTRIEVHCRPNRHASDLVSLPNPFQKFRVHDIKNADLVIGEAPRKSFARAASAFGIEAVLSDYPGLAAKKLKAAILASPASFWQPDVFWQKWPEVIQGVLPSFGNANQYGTTDGQLNPAFVQSFAQIHTSPAGGPEA